MVFSKCCAPFTCDTTPCPWRTEKSTKVQCYDQILEESFSQWLVSNLYILKEPVYVTIELTFEDKKNCEPNFLWTFLCKCNIFRNSVIEYWVVFYAILGRSSWFLLQFCEKVRESCFLRNFLQVFELLNYGRCVMHFVYPRLHCTVHIFWRVLLCACILVLHQKALCYCILYHFHTELSKRVFNVFFLLVNNFCISHININLKWNLLLLMVVVSCIYYKILLFVYHSLLD